MKNPFDKAKAARVQNLVPDHKRIGKCSLCHDHFYLPDLEKHDCRATQNNSSHSDSIENDAGDILVGPDTSGPSGDNRDDRATSVHELPNRDPGDETA